MSWCIYIYIMFYTYIYMYDVCIEYNIRSININNRKQTQYTFKLIYCNCIINHNCVASLIRRKRIKKHTLESGPFDVRHKMLIVKTYMYIIFCFIKKKTNEAVGCNKYVYTDKPDNNDLRLYVNIFTFHRRTYRQTYFQIEGHPKGKQL